MSETKYVEIATALPIDRTFQYSITGRERFLPEIGKRAFIPFRNMRRIGYIVAIEDKPQVENPKPVMDIIDEKPILSPDMIELAVWMKDRYLCSLGEALDAMVPSALTGGKFSMTSRL